MRDLNSIRIDIDRLDDQLLSLLSQRFDLVKEVAEYKKAHSIKPLQPKRWEEVQEKLRLKASALGLNEGMVVEIYDMIHRQSIKNQEDSIEG